MSTQTIPLPSEREAAPANSADDLLTEKAAARRIGYRPNTLAGWRVSKRVKLPYIIVGGGVRYRPSDIEKFLLKRTVGEDGIVPKGVKRRRGGPGRPPRSKGRAQQGHTEQVGRKGSKQAGA